jgi:hypothetical protein
MKHVIKHLESVMQNELNLVGRSTTTLFIGNQQDHDYYHTGLYHEYKKAIEILKSYKTK